MNKLLSSANKLKDIWFTALDVSLIYNRNNNGDRSYCNSNGGISLLNVVGKVFARVALARLQIATLFELFYKHYKQITYFIFEDTIDCHVVATAFNCIMQFYYKTENMVQVKLNALI